MQRYFLKSPRLVSFRGQTIPEPRPNWSALRVNFKIPDEHPHLFYIRVPIPGIPRVRDSWEFLVIKRLVALSYDGGPSFFRDMFV